MSSRIKFREGSSLPYFEGDSRTMKASELKELVTKAELRPVAREELDQLKEFIKHEMMFRGNVATLAFQVVRRHMGSDRPLNEDDREYFEACDWVVRRIADAMIRGAEEEFNKMFA